MPRLASALAAALAATFCVSTASWAAPYVYTPLPGGFGSGNAIPTGISNAGTVVGNENANILGSTPFTVQGGTVTTGPGASPSGNLLFLGSNSAGDVLNQLVSTNGPTQTVQLFVSGPGIAGAVNVPSFAQAINDSLTVAGSPGPTSIQIDTAGVVQTQAVPGATLAAYVNGINNSGQVAGSYANASGAYGFIYANGTFSTVQGPGSTDTFLGGINNLGQVVGGYYTANGPAGFVYDGCSFTFLSGSSPPAIPTAVNDSGEIAGYYFGGISKYGNVSVGAFVATPSATPVPEPASLSLLGVGLLATALTRRPRGRGKPGP